MRRTLGSRKGIGAGAMVALCLAAASAVAQDRPVTTRQDRADTVKINVSGRIEMDYVQREGALVAIDGMGIIAGIENSVNTVEGEVAIRLDAELSEKVSVVVEIGRLRVIEDGIFGSGVVPFLGLGGSFLDNIALREAHLKVADFLAQGLTAHMGITNWSFGARPGRGSLAFDPHYSQSITRNVFDAQDDVGSMGSRYGIGSAAELEAMGLHLSYTSGQVTVDLVALPMVIEGGTTSDDEALYAVNFWYNLDQMGKGSRIGAIAAFHNLPGVAGLTGSGSRMMTFGAAANLVFGQLEIFAEGYVNTGTVGRDGANNDFDAAGHALQIGGRYNAGDAGNSWIEVSFTLISGDDDSDEEVGNFLGYESINDFLIMEDMYFGLDVDSNLTAIKIMGGTSFSVAGGRNNLELNVGLGFFTATEEVVNTTGDDEDAFGTEVNVKARYHLNKQAFLSLNFGMLFGSDLLEEMGVANLGSGADTPDDSTWLASLGFNVRY